MFLTWLVMAGFSVVTGGLLGTSIYDRQVADCYRRNQALMTEGKQGPVQACTITERRGN